PEQLESLDFASTPAHVLNGLEREELVALSSTLLHELYFASMGGDGQIGTRVIRAALERDFGSYQGWRSQFSSMGYALGGGSGWVLLTGVPRHGRLDHQDASDHRHAAPRADTTPPVDNAQHAPHMDVPPNVM